MTRPVSFSQALCAPYGRQPATMRAEDEFMVFDEFTSSAVFVRTPPNGAHWAEDPSHVHGPLTQDEALAASALVRLWTFDAAQDLYESAQVLPKVHRYLTEDGALLEALGKDRP